MHVRALTGLPQNLNTGRRSLIVALRLTMGRSLDAITNSTSGMRSPNNFCSSSMTCGTWVRAKQQIAAMWHAFYTHGPPPSARGLAARIPHT